jgi:hypothetical protein
MCFLGQILGYTAQMVSVSDLGSSLPSCYDFPTEANWAFANIDILS